MDADRPTSPRLLAWVGIALLILYLTVVGGGDSNGIVFARFRAVSFALIAAGLLAWFAVAARRPAWRPRSALAAALVLGLLAFAISTATSSIPRLSAEYLAYAVLLVGLYLLLVRLLADGFFRPRIGALVVGLAVILPLLYLAVVVRAWIDWWSLVGHLAVPPLRPNYEGLTVGSPNTLAALTILFAASAVAVVGAFSRGRRITVLALLGLAAAAVLLTGSRGAWLGVGVGLAVSAALVLGRPTGRAAATAALRAMPRTGLVAAGIAAAAVAVVLGPSIAGRFLAGGGDGLRLGLVSSALRMFQDDPLTGSGPGTWVVRRTAFTASGEIDYYIPHTHNIAAQALAEFGLVGLVAAAVGVVLVGRLVLGALDDPDPTRRRIARAAAFAIPALAAHQMVDSFANSPAVIFATALPIAWLDATGASPDPGRRAWRWPAALLPAGTAVLAVACALSVVSAAALDRSAPAVETAAATADRGDWAAALVAARDAADVDPDLPIHHFVLGLAEAHAGEPDAAATELGRFVAIDDFPQAWLNLAKLAADRGDAAAARTALDRALRLGLQQPAVAIAAGAVALELGDPRRASDLFATGLAGAPTLAGDPYWTAAAPLRELRNETLELAIARADPSTAFTIAIYADRHAAAAAQLVGMSARDAEVANLVIAGWAGNPEARARLVRLAEQNPSDGNIVVWCARLAHRAGDDASRLRFLNWAATTTILGNEIGLDVIVTDDPHPGLQVPGPNANFHGYYAYRRPLPWDLLVPGLPKLTLG